MQVPEAYTDTFAAEDSSRGFLLSVLMLLISYTTIDTGHLILSQSGASK